MMISPSELLKILGQYEESMTVGELKAKLLAEIEAARIPKQSPTMNVECRYCKRTFEAKVSSYERGAITSCGRKKCRAAHTEASGEWSGGIDFIREQIAKLKSQDEE